MWTLSGGIVYRDATKTVPLNMWTVLGYMAIIETGLNLAWMLLDPLQMTMTTRYYKSIDHVSLSYEQHECTSENKVLRRDSYHCNYHNFVLNPFACVCAQVSVLCLCCCVPN